jgi:hypothetical protein
MTLFVTGFLKGTFLIAKKIHSANSKMAQKQFAALMCALIRYKREAIGFKLLTEP